MPMEKEMQEKNALDNLSWCDFRPTHLDSNPDEFIDSGQENSQINSIQNSEPPAWSIPIKNRLGHVSGRLPENPADYCMTWHFATYSRPTTIATTTWSRLAAKARILASITRREVIA